MRAISPVAPQLAHIPTAVVISTANTSRRAPAAAFPSSISSSISSSCRAEALGLDPHRLVTELHERVCHCFDKWCWAAHEGEGEIGRRHLVQQGAIDAPVVPGPAGRLRV